MSVRLERGERIYKWDSEGAIVEERGHEGREREKERESKRVRGGGCDGARQGKSGTEQNEDNKTHFPRVQTV